MGLRRLTVARTPLFIAVGSTHFNVTNGSAEDLTADGDFFEGRPELK